MVSLFLRFRCFNLPRITPSSSTFRFVILIASFSLLFLAVPAKKTLREKQSKRRGKGQLFCNPDSFHDTRSGDFFRENKMQVVFHPTLLSPSNFRAVHFLSFTQTASPTATCTHVIPRTHSAAAAEKGARRVGRFFAIGGGDSAKLIPSLFSLFLVVFVAAPADL